MVIERQGTERRTGGDEGGAGKGERKREWEGGRKERGDTWISGSFRSRGPSHRYESQ